MSNEVLVPKLGEHEFTDEELLELKDEIVRNNLIIITEKDAIHELSESVKAHKSTVASLYAKTLENAKAIERGKEARTFNCKRLKNWDSFSVEFFDELTGNKITQEPFSADDHQIDIDDEVLKIKGQVRDIWTGKDSVDMKAQSQLWDQQRMEADQVGNEFKSRVRSTQIEAMDALIQNLNTDSDGKE